ncbi:hypothetical protein [Brevundimonas sp.]|uniref:hypothetical protein n=1 Tax=Brevundimonas sp. TaxID=1871086 RepID=UPI002737B9E5|nr:hypothetical protein [Brevundimonas sp.]MDP3802759.1 hypothetical protein [Brevundimonas sp.]
MHEGHARKLRSDDTWRAVRRAWEAGETAASLARRYDVGLANLWRRRASEGWKRRETADPDPEPAEGWDGYARRKQFEFEYQLVETRLLATKLAEAMQGGPLERVSVWHLGFVLEWRADNLTPETAARDRAWAVRHGWTAAFWNETGWLHPLSYLDAVTLQANRDAWREDARLPPGTAESWPS